MTDVEALAAALGKVREPRWVQYAHDITPEAILAALRESGWTVAPVGEATPRLGLQPISSVDERSLPRRARP